MKKYIIGLLTLSATACGMKYEAGQLVSVTHGVYTNCMGTLVNDLGDSNWEANLSCPYFTYWKPVGVITINEQNFIKQ